MRTTFPDKSGVVSGRGSQASSGTVVEVEVANTGSVPLTGRGVGLK